MNEQKELEQELDREEQKLLDREDWGRATATESGRREISPRV
jgi:hypothetical protein